MKKTLILSITLILFAVQMMGQKARIDTATLRCKYTFTHITNLTKNTGYSELMTLDIGKNICKFYSENQELYDSIMKEQVLTAMEKAGASRKITLVSPSSVSQSREKTVVFFNYPIGKITVSERIIEFYEYTENIESINWQFFPDEAKEILGYNCKKATCTFRGRDYEAWYAPDIPINRGPYKFSGLPGLILRVSDSQEQVQFVCESIEKLSVPITIDNEIYGDAVKISRREYLKIERDFYGNPMSVMGQFSGTGTDASGNPLPPVRNLPYNPIELE
ncbi:MAG: GLPGLI family protein [Prevotellaceae bacterium]|jgi:GLPGLI family protein|nr:GLPGLI family protein [Prevotellaceae bacterium]